MKAWKSAALSALAVAGLLAVAAYAGPVSTPLSKDLPGVIGTTVNTVAANSAGNQASATTLSLGFNRVTSGGTGYSVKLPSPAVGDVVQLLNETTTTVLLFPQSGGTINSLSSNASFAVAQSSTNPNGQELYTCIATTSTQWKCTTSAGMTNFVDNATYDAFHVYNSVGPTDASYRYANFNIGPLLAIRGGGNTYATVCGLGDTGSCAAADVGFNANTNLQFRWSNNTYISGTYDTGLARNAAGVVRVSDGTTGYGTLISKGVELMLGSASIDLNSDTDQTIYTVPTGVSCIVTRFVVAAASTSLTTATFGAGFAAGGTDVVAAIGLTELTGSTLYKSISPISGAKIGTTGQTLKFNPGTVQGATATATVYTFGIIY